MKYVMIATALIGALLAWVEGIPDPSTYAGERLFDQTEIIAFTLILLAIELLIWLL
jgi:hypothetical protein